MLTICKHTYIKDSTYKDIHYAVEEIDVISYHVMERFVCTKCGKKYIHSHRTKLEPLDEDSD
jgi:hypothetical protein